MTDYPVVYSTEPGWCSRCRSHPCACATKPQAGRSGRGGGAPAPSGKAVPGTLRLRLEKSGRGGKVVTAVYDLPADPVAAQALLKELKVRCGSGGTLKGTALEIQGDHRDRIEAWLLQAGYKVKRAGG